MKITSFADVHTVLESYVPPARSMRGAYTLETMKRLMDVLGNPQDTFRSVHVAGTSGKTSTAYFIASLLRESGYTVGLTVSPHIDEVNERVQINLQSLDESRYCAWFAIFIGIVEKSGIKPTYFELLVAFAFWCFAKEGVDYAVIEVGLGGLLDATNVMHRPDKICVITDIGIDHTTVLGRTVAAIAAQKAGIVQQHNTVLMYQQSETIMNIVEEVAEQEHATLHEIKPLSPAKMAFDLPIYQKRNWYLALAAVRIIHERDNVPELSEEQLLKSIKIVIPARMQLVNQNNKIIIFDGAHNVQKMAALVKSMQAEYPGQPVAVMLGMVQGKTSHITAVLKRLSPIMSYLMITSFQNIQDMRKSSIKPAKIAERAHLMGFQDWEIESDPKKAYQKLLQRPEEVLLITGSFYLINELRPVILQRSNKS